MKKTSSIALSLLVFLSSSFPGGLVPVLAAQAQADDAAAIESSVLGMESVFERASAALQSASSVQGQAKAPELGTYLQKLPADENLEEAFNEIQARMDGLNDSDPAQARRKAAFKDLQDRLSKLKDRLPDLRQGLQSAQVSRTLSVLNARLDEWLKPGGPIRSGRVPSGQLKPLQEQFNQLDAHWVEETNSIPEEPLASLQDLKAAVQKKLLFLSRIGDLGFNLGKMDKAQKALFVTEDGRLGPLAPALLQGDAGAVQVKLAMDSVRRELAKPNPNQDAIADRLGAIYGEVARHGDEADYVDLRSGLDDYLAAYNEAAPAPKRLKIKPPPDLIRSGAVKVDAEGNINFEAMARGASRGLENLGGVLKTATAALVQGLASPPPGAARNPEAEAAVRRQMTQRQNGFVEAAGVYLGGNAAWRAFNAGNRCSPPATAGDSAACADKADQILSQDKSSYGVLRSYRRALGEWGGAKQSRLSAGASLGPGVDDADGKKALIAIYNNRCPAGAEPSPDNPCAQLTEEQAGAMVNLAASVQGNIASPPGDPDSQAGRTAAAMQAAARAYQASPASPEAVSRMQAAARELDNPWILSERSAQTYARMIGCAWDADCYIRAAHAAIGSDAGNPNLAKQRGLIQNKILQWQQAWRGSLLPGLGQAAAALTDPAARQKVQAFLGDQSRQADRDSILEAFRTAGLCVLDARMIQADPKQGALCLANQAGPEREFQRFRLLADTQARLDMAYDRAIAPYQRKVQDSQSGLSAALRDCGRRRGSAAEALCSARARQGAELSLFGPEPDRKRFPARWEAWNRNRALLAEARSYLDARSASAAMSKFFDARPPSDRDLAARLLDRRSNLVALGSAALENGVLPDGTEAWMAGLDYPRGTKITRQALKPAGLALGGANSMDRARNRSRDKNERRLRQLASARLGCAFGLEGSCPAVDGYRIALPAGMDGSQAWEFKSLSSLFGDKYPGVPSISATFMSGGGRREARLGAMTIDLPSGAGLPKTAIFLDGSRNIYLRTEARGSRGAPAYRYAGTRYFQAANGKVMFLRGTFGDDLEIIGGRAYRQGSADVRTGAQRVLQEGILDSRGRLVDGMQFGRDRYGAVATRIAGSRVVRRSSLVPVPQPGRGARLVRLTDEWHHRQAISGPGYRMRATVHTQRLGNGASMLAGIGEGRHEVPVSRAGAFAGTVPVADRRHNRVIGFVLQGSRVAPAREGVYIRVPDPARSRPAGLIIPVARAWGSRGGFAGEFTDARGEAHRYEDVGGEALRRERSAPAATYSYWRLPNYIVRRSDGNGVYADPACLPGQSCLALLGRDASGGRRSMRFSAPLHAVKGGGSAAVELLVNERGDPRTGALPGTLARAQRTYLAQNGHVYTEIFSYDRLQPSSRPPARSSPRASPLPPITPGETGSLEPSAGLSLGGYEQDYKKWQGQNAAFQERQRRQGRARIAAISRIRPAQYGDTRLWVAGDALSLSATPKLLLDSAPPQSVYLGRRGSSPGRLTPNIVLESQYEILMVGGKPQQYLLSAVGRDAQGRGYDFARSEEPPRDSAGRMTGPPPTPRLSMRHGRLLAESVTTVTESPAYAGGVLVRDPTDPCSHNPGLCAAYGESARIEMNRRSVTETLRDDQGQWRPEGWVPETVVIGGRRMIPEGGSRGHSFSVSQEGYDAARGKFYQSNEQYAWGSTLGDASDGERMDSYNRLYFDGINGQGRYMGAESVLHGRFGDKNPETLQLAGALEPGGGSLRGRLLRWRGQDENRRQVWQDVVLSVDDQGGLSGQGFARLEVLGDPSQTKVGRLAASGPLYGFEFNPDLTRDFAARRSREQYNAQPWYGKAWSRTEGAVGALGEGVGAVSQGIAVPFEVAYGGAMWLAGWTTVGVGNMLNSDAMAMAGAKVGQDGYDAVYNSAASRFAREGLGLKWNYEDVTTGGARELRAEEGLDWAREQGLATQSMTEDELLGQASSMGVWDKVAVAEKQSWRQGTAVGAVDNAIGFVARTADKGAQFLVFNAGLKAVGSVPVGQSLTLAQTQGGAFLMAHGMQVAMAPGFVGGTLQQINSLRSGDLDWGTFAKDQGSTLIGMALAGAAEPYGGAGMKVEGASRLGRLAADTAFRELPKQTALMGGQAAAGYALNQAGLSPQGAALLGGVGVGAAAHERSQARNKAPRAQVNENELAPAPIAPQPPIEAGRSPAVSQEDVSLPNGSVSRTQAAFGGGPLPNDSSMRHFLAGELGHISSPEGSVMLLPQQQAQTDARVLRDAPIQILSVSPAPRDLAAARQAATAELRLAEVQAKGRLGWRQGRAAPPSTARPASLLEGAPLLARSAANLGEFQAYDLARVRSASGDPILEAISRQREAARSRGEDVVAEPASVRRVGQRADPNYVGQTCTIDALAAQLSHIGIQAPGGKPYTGERLLRELRGEALPGPEGKAFIELVKLHGMEPDQARQAFTVLAKRLNFAVETVPRGSVLERAGRQGQGVWTNIQTESGLHAVYVTDVRSVGGRSYVEFVDSSIGRRVALPRADFEALLATGGLRIEPSNGPPSRESLRAAEAAKSGFRRSVVRDLSLELAAKELGRDYLGEKGWLAQARAIAARELGKPLGQTTPDDVGDLLNGPRRSVLLAELQAEEPADRAEFARFSFRPGREGRGGLKDSRARRAEQDQFNEAAKGLSKRERRRLHDEVTKKGLQGWEITLERNSLFPRKPYSGGWLVGPPAGARPASAPHPAEALLSRVPNAADREMLRRAIAVDPLTGLKSESALKEDAPELVRTRGEALLLDIDNFGAFNRHLGGPRADGVLQRFSDLLQDTVRRSGLPGDIYRAGGEEILIFTDKGEGAPLAELIRRDVGREFVPTLIREGIVTEEEMAQIQAARSGERGRQPTGTVSIGVAPLKAHDAPPKALRKARALAEEALSSAKVSGRDRVAVARPDGSILLPEPIQAAEPQARPPASHQSAAPSPVGHGEGGAVLRALEEIRDPELRDDLREQLFRDDKTPLWNGKFLRLNAENLLRQNGTLARVEIEGLKDVNDAAGHPAGDRMLRAYGTAFERLSAGLGVQVIRRLGKDFVVLGERGQVAEFLKRASGLSPNGLLKSSGLSDEELSAVREHAVGRGKEADSVGRLTSGVTDISFDGSTGDPYQTMVETLVRAGRAQAAFGGDTSSPEGSVGRTQTEPGPESGPGFRRSGANLSPVGESDAVAAIRSGLAEAEALGREGKPREAMERLIALEESPAYGGVRDYRLALELKRRTSSLEGTLQRQGSGRAYGKDLRRALPRELLALSPDAGSIHDWALRRFREDPTSVVGELSTGRTQKQEFDDCAVRALWNHPALRALHDRMTYDQFLTWAEKTAGEPIRAGGAGGLSDEGREKILHALGVDLEYLGRPRSEAALVELLRGGEGALGSLSIEDVNDHNVVLNGAIQDGGRWHFIVTDSNSSRPRIFSYAELRLMGVETATFKPRPNAEGAAEDLPIPSQSEVWTRRAVELAFRHAPAWPEPGKVLKGPAVLEGLAGELASPGIRRSGANVQKTAQARPPRPREEQEITRVRRSLERAQRLAEQGQFASAMEKLSQAQNAWRAAKTSQVPDRMEIMRSMAQLATRLKTKADPVYFRPQSRTAQELYDWAQSRFARDPTSVAGVLSPEKIGRQKFSDCAVRAIWNHPQMSHLRELMSYDQFLALAEKVTKKDIRRQGLNDMDARRLMEALGVSRSYDSEPVDATELVSAIREGNGVIGSLDFKMSPLRALLGYGSLDRDFVHAVVINGAVREKGEWKFVVTDSNSSHPRLFTFGELKLMGVEYATLEPTPETERLALALPRPEPALVQTRKAVDLLIQHADVIPRPESPEGIFKGPDWLSRAVMRLLGQTPPALSPDWVGLSGGKVPRGAALQGRWLSQAYDKLAASGKPAPPNLVAVAPDGKTYLNARLLKALDQSGWLEGRGSPDSQGAYPPLKVGKVLDQRSFSYKVSTPEGARWLKQGQDELDSEYEVHRAAYEVSRDAFPEGVRIPAVEARSVDDQGRLKAISPGEPWLAIEPMSGVPITADEPNAPLSAHRPMSESDFARLRAAVEALHEAGIAHGDLTNFALRNYSNILVNRDPYGHLEFSIFDFGKGIREAVNDKAFKEAVQKDKLSLDELELELMREGKLIYAPPEPLFERAVDGLRRSGANVARPEPRLAEPSGQSAPPPSFSIGDHFSPERFAALHPEPTDSAIYHGRRHSENVARLEYELALARGLSPADAKFLGETALLHDIDPTRQPGRPARVAATMAWLRGPEGQATLKAWGWSASQARMAEALIQRTEFPFNDAKGEARKVAVYPDESPELGAYYEKLSAIERYKAMLRALPPGDRAFVLREAPILSEYPDKSSWYFDRPADSLEAVRGLKNEAGFDALPGTRKFLDAIGQPESFEADRQVARELGLPEPHPPLLQDVLGMLGPDKRANWEAQLQMYDNIAHGMAPEEAAREAEPPAQTGLMRSGANLQPIGPVLGLKGRGKYISDGDFGMVYRVSSERGLLAVKIPLGGTDDGSPRFLKEARLMREIDSKFSDPALAPESPMPHNVSLAKLAAYGSIDRAALGENERGSVEALATEWAPGKTLEEYIDRGGKIKASDWEGMRRAVDRLHALGYTHGDLHSENIMVAPGPQPERTRFVLIDFGQASSVAKDPRAFSEKTARDAWQFEKVEQYLALKQGLVFDAQPAAPRAAAASLPRPDNVFVPMGKPEGISLYAYLREHRGAKGRFSGQPIGWDDWRAFEGFIHAMNARGIAHGELTNEENVLISRNPETGRTRFSLVNFSRGSVGNPRDVARDASDVLNLRWRLQAHGALEQEPRAGQSEPPALETQGRGPSGR